MEGEERYLKMISGLGGGIGKEEERGGGNVKSSKENDKSDRATSEQVLDPRTRMILFKFLNGGLLEELNGCLSTGKEANVYHGKTKEGQERAIKIYKTSILIFKDRDRYVTGEFRFRRGYAKHNPRKMVKLWAEKELRNLNRLKSAEIPCPDPIILRNHVLVMSFIGTDGLPAPKLKDANLSEDRLRECYLQCIKIMRKMYHQCKLVHADLSEYNILYFKKSLYFIDVSQSVEHDHPQALEFLRSDCTNITDFFSKKGVQNCMRTKQLFDFVTDPTINEENIDEYLDTIQEQIAKQGEITNEERVTEEVFKNVYIPRSLTELSPGEVERDLLERKEGNTEGNDRISYQTIIGLRQDLSGIQTIPELLQKKEVKNKKYEKITSTKEEKQKLSQKKPSKSETEDVEEDDSEDEEPDSNEESGSEDDSEEEDSESEEEKEGKEWEERPKNKEDPAARKERKKATKEANREKRKHKVPKYIKKAKKAGKAKK
eukprot:TRINITY_DN3441_c0_g1_i1.p1 TRINITY_DN3441_c0_g1~~TRINITY_DN3441_c0_g1_i1.p1  ORF type:complete len:488 (+),score=185.54 TRINITY_DN3441_c0_g1_i1:155-1618(+)